MEKLRRYLSIAALAVAAAIIVSCDAFDEFLVPVNGTWDLSIELTAPGFTDSPSITGSADLLRDGTDHIAGQLNSVQFSGLDFFDQLPLDFYGIINGAAAQMYFQLYTDEVTLSFTIDGDFTGNAFDGDCECRISVGDLGETYPGTITMEKQ